MAAGAKSRPRKAGAESPAPRAGAEALRESLLRNRLLDLAKDEYSATPLDNYKSLALAVRDQLYARWAATQQTYYSANTKRVYYLSLEFLMGRALCNAIVNLDIEAEAREALHSLGMSLEELRELEPDAGLGNGGLGRLAACFLDSMATLQLPAYGYGIRYEYGIFYQHIRDGWQVETPDNWLRYGNPWEIERQSTSTRCASTAASRAPRTPTGGCASSGWTRRRSWPWPTTRLSRATATTRSTTYACGRPRARGSSTSTTSTTATTSRRFREKAQSETISKVLYPNDNVFEGRELRLKQEYFFVSATMQDIFRRYRKTAAPEGLPLATSLRKSRSS